jgi:hypothetical protein
MTYSVLMDLAAQREAQVAAAARSPRPEPITPTDLPRTQKRVRAGVTIRLRGLTARA